MKKYVTFIGIYNIYRHTFWVIHQGVISVSVFTSTELMMRAILLGFFYPWY
jgi:hypothetical protein